MNANQAPPRISERLKTKIVETVSLNRITIIVGPTGSGKSTQVPQLLLDGLQQGQGGGGCSKSSILCSQPRRLAVVAIAKRVAQERKVTLGSHVGYHVGNYNLSTHKTKLLFTTAGILLEELRNNGVQALSKFKCIIIDECHERSPESDLVLVLVKKFMQTHPREPIRIVLMSATFDSRRYASYFDGVPGCDPVDCITLETAESFKAWHTQVTTYYLNDLPLPKSELKVHEEFLRLMRLNPDSDINHGRGKTLSDPILLLIQSLVSWLDKAEPADAPFLIFAPTYRHLEQLYNTLFLINGKASDISVLHSAVDIEDCIRTMSNGTSSHYQKRNVGRHILLASAIADSSVTVPGVSCVIDPCRALQVRWDLNSKSYIPKVVWCSKSIAEQRRGRTGRTCPGRVFRLVHQGFYIQRLRQWDVPQLTMSSCHNEVLAMVCADNDKVKIGDPKRLFRQCLDPPDSEVVEEAIDYLIEIDACQKVTSTEAGFYMRGGIKEKILPSDYGTLLSSLSMSVNDARIVVEGARIGLLYETLALMAICDHRPSPIVHHFSQPDKNQCILESFYYDVEVNSSPSIALANLSAYMYWDSHWNQEHNKRTMRKFRDVSGVEHVVNDDRVVHAKDPWWWTAKTDGEHVEWCKLNDVNPTSMRSISEIIETTMNVLFLSKHEPEWLQCSNPTPIWKRRDDWEFDHADYGRDMLPRIYGDERATVLCDTLMKLVSSRSAVASLPLAKKFLGISFSNVTDTTENVPTACVHFIMGNCKFGDSCRQSHSHRARRPPCRFFQSGRCNKGDQCIFAHDDPEEDVAQRRYGPADALVPVLKSLHLSGGAHGWYTRNAPNLLLLGEGNFRFTRALSTLGTPPLASSSILPSSTAMPGALIGIDATKLHWNDDVMNLVFRKNAVGCFAWNSPFTGTEEDSSEHEALILQFLQSLVLLYDETPCFYISLGIALQGDQFSRWNVIRSAWRTGWNMVGWAEFDHKAFPGYHPCRQNGEPFPVESARLYIFELQR